MKKIFIYPIIILLTMLLIQACDVVDEPYFEGNPYSGVYDSDLPIRKILLEDFTGFRCVNCPKATQELNRIKNSYGDHIIPIGIHTGFFATPFTVEEPDFRTTVGDEITKYFVDPDLAHNPPLGVINRKLFEGNTEYELTFEEWSARIVDILKFNRFADIDIDLESTYNEADSLLNLGVTCKEINALDGEIKLSLYIIENEIEGIQHIGSKIDSFYVHNHVLRGGMITDDPTWGEKISLPANNSYSYKIPAEWNVNHCAVVAVVYYSDSREVIQTEEVHIIE